MKAEPRRAVRIISRCASWEDFVTVFRPHLAGGSLFIATAAPLADGAALAFTMTLAGGRPVLRGHARVIAGDADPRGQPGARGVTLRLESLDPGSQRRLAALEAQGARLAAARGPTSGEPIECAIEDDVADGEASTAPAAAAPAASRDEDDEGDDDDLTEIASSPVRPPRGPGAARSSTATATAAAIAGGAGPESAATRAEPARPAPLITGTVPTVIGVPPGPLPAPALAGEAPVAASDAEVAARPWVPRPTTEEEDTTDATGTPTPPPALPTTVTVVAHVDTIRPPATAPTMPAPVPPTAVATDASTDGVADDEPTDRRHTHASDGVAAARGASAAPSQQTTIAPMPTAPRPDAAHVTPAYPSPPHPPDATPVPMRPRAAAAAGAAGTPMPPARRGDARASRRRPERTEIVRLTPSSALASIVVASTIAALLGLGVGYVLWGRGAAAPAGTRGTEQVDRTAP